MNDPIVISFLGQSVGIGMLSSAITQVVKMTESIPYLSNIPLVQKIIDSVDSGNVRQNQIFVACVAVILNIGVTIIHTHSLPMMPTILSTFGSFLSALGTYDAVKDRTPQA